MKNSGTKLWDFGSIPMIEPEYLGSILAAASDIALVVTLKGKVLSAVSYTHLTLPTNVAV